VVAELHFRFVAEVMVRCDYQEVSGNLEEPPQRIEFAVGGALAYGQHRS
jgi:hypothetical protein